MATGNQAGASDDHLHYSSQSGSTSDISPASNLQASSSAQEKDATRDINPRRSTSILRGRKPKLPTLRAAFDRETGKDHVFVYHADEHAHAKAHEQGLKVDQFNKGSVSPSPSWTSSSYSPEPPPPKLELDQGTSSSTIIGTPTVQESSTIAPTTTTSTTHESHPPSFQRKPSLFKHVFSCCCTCQEVEIDTVDKKTTIISPTQTSTSPISPIPQTKTKPKPAPVTGGPDDPHLQKFVNEAERKAKEFKKKRDAVKFQEEMMVNNASDTTLLRSSRSFDGRRESSGCADGVEAGFSIARRASLLRRVSTLEKLIESESRKKLKEYKFIKTLGAGAQGSVSLSLHIPTDSIVAVKSIPTAASAVDPHVRESYRREVAILKLTSIHPSIIRLLDNWEGRETVYQVFTVATGGDLTKGLPGPLPGEEAVRLVAPIADALRFLHALGILHRDVRPANVFLRRPITGKESLQELQTIPLLADFGIANFAKYSGRLGTKFDQPPPHIAPEVLKGTRFTAASDCYGLGLVAFEILLGRPPTLPEMRNPDILQGFPIWNNVTIEGQNFVKALVNPDSVSRMTAAQAVNSDWMVRWGVIIVGPEVKDALALERVKEAEEAWLGADGGDVGAAEGFLAEFEALRKFIEE
ncbi:Checkpoint kinase 2 [Blyttiomyces sp. JEL0837]|nr:Checkpoint kinase 2 [Blyttiomyces sp. JEL0837]